MDKRSLEDLLNLYGLPGADDGAAWNELAALPPEERAELESLMQVSALLEQTLTPAPLRMAFREDLRQSLLSAAMQRPGWRGVFLVSLRQHW